MSAKSAAVPEVGRPDSVQELADWVKSFSPAPPVSVHHAHHLRWQPGTEGKGFLLDDGSVWTWPTKDMRPIHMAKAYTASQRGHEVKKGTAFHITSEGQVWHLADARQLSAVDRKVMVRADARLRPMPTGWEPRDAEVTRVHTARLDEALRRLAAEPNYEPAACPGCGEPHDPNEPCVHDGPVVMPDPPADLKTASKDDNYIEGVMDDLREAIDGPCGEGLLRLYALLALSKGTSTTAEDVHDAWSTWKDARTPGHKSIEWFDDLDEDIQEMDEPYVTAIHEVARKLKTRTSGTRCPGCGLPTLEPDGICRRCGYGDPAGHDWVESDRGELTCATCGTQDTLRGTRGRCPGEYVQDPDMEAWMHAAAWEDATVEAWTPVTQAHTRKSAQPANSGTARLLKDYASTIDHCGDYGLLFWNAAEGHAMWISGDADGPPDYTDPTEIYSELKRIPGVKKVTVEAEIGDPKGSGWKRLARHEAANRHATKGHQTASSRQSRSALRPPTSRARLPRSQAPEAPLGTSPSDPRQDDHDWSEIARLATHSASGCDDQTSVGQALAPGLRAVAVVGHTSDHVLLAARDGMTRSGDGIEVTGSWSEVAHDDIVVHDGRSSLGLDEFPELVVDRGQQVTDKHDVADRPAGFHGSALQQKDGGDAGPSDRLEEASRSVIAPEDHDGHREPGGHADPQPDWEEEQDAEQTLEDRHGSGPQQVDDEVDGSFAHYVQSAEDVVGEVLSSRDPHWDQEQSPDAVPQDVEDACWEDEHGASEASQRVHGSARQTDEVADAEARTGSSEDREPDGREEWVEVEHGSVLGDREKGAAQYGDAPPHRRSGGESVAEDADQQHRGANEAEDTRVVDLHTSQSTMNSAMFNSWAEQGFEIGPEPSGQTSHEDSSALIQASSPGAELLGLQVGPLSVDQSPHHSGVNVMSDVSHQVVVEGLNAHGSAPATRQRSGHELELANLGEDLWVEGGDSKQSIELGLQADERGTRFDALGAHDSAPLRDQADDAIDETPSDLWSDVDLGTDLVGRHSSAAVPLVQDRPAVNGERDQAGALLVFDHQSVEVSTGNNLVVGEHLPVASPRVGVVVLAPRDEVEHGSAPPSEQALPHRRSTQNGDFGQLAFGGDHSWHVVVPEDHDQVVVPVGFGQVGPVAARHDEDLHTMQSIMAASRPEEYEHSSSAPSPGHNQGESNATQDRTAASGSEPSRPRRANQEPTSAASASRSASTANPGRRDELAAIRGLDQGSESTSARDAASWSPSAPTGDEGASGDRPTTSPLPRELSRGSDAIPSSPFAKPSVSQGYPLDREERGALHLGDATPAQGSASRGPRTGSRPGSPPQSEPLVPLRSSRPASPASAHTPQAPLSRPLPTRALASRTQPSPQGQEWQDDDQSAGPSSDGWLAQQQEAWAVEQIQGQRARAEEQASAQSTSSQSSHLGLKAWTTAIGPYATTDLAGNWQRIDAHDMTNGNHGPTFADWKEMRTAYTTAGRDTRNGERTGASIRASARQQTRGAHAIPILVADSSSFASARPPVVGEPEHPLLVEADRDYLPTRVEDDGVHIAEQDFDGGGVLKQGPRAHAVGAAEPTDGVSLSGVWFDSGHTEQLSSSGESDRGPTMSSAIPPSSAWYEDRYAEGEHLDAFREVGNDCSGHQPDSEAGGKRDEQYQASEDRSGAESERAEGATDADGGEVVAQHGSVTSPAVGGSGHDHQAASSNGQDRVERSYSDRCHDQQPSEQDQREANEGTHAAKFTASQSWSTAHRSYASPVRVGGTNPVHVGTSSPNSQASLMRARVGQAQPTAHSASPVKPPTHAENVRPGVRQHSSEQRSPAAITGINRPSGTGPYPVPHAVSSAQHDAQAPAPWEAEDVRPEEGMGPVRKGGTPSRNSEDISALAARTLASRHVDSGSPMWSPVIGSHPAGPLLSDRKGPLSGSRVAADDEDYRMQHTAPGPGSGSPMHDLTEGGTYPADIYTHPHYYGVNDDPHERESYSTALDARGRPDKLVSIYRAGPVGVLNHQDWVTPSFDYARQHGMHPSDPAQDMPVWKYRVPASSLYTEGNSLAEYGFNGPAHAARDVYRSTQKRWRPVSEKNVHPLTPEQWQEYRAWCVERTKRVVERRRQLAEEKAAQEPRESRSPWEEVQAENSENFQALGANGVARSAPTLERMSGETRSQILRRAQEHEVQFGPDGSTIAHQWPDGWSIRRLETNADAHREGTLMGNCYARPASEQDAYKMSIWTPDMDDHGDHIGPGHPEWTGWPSMREPIGYGFHDDDHYSLRDPDNLPHVTFQGDENGDLSNAYGRHNSSPKFEHVDRLKQWIDATQDQYARSRPDYYETDDEGMGHTPWRGSPFDDWWKYHRDLANLTPAVPSSPWEPVSSRVASTYDPQHPLGQLAAQHPYVDLRAFEGDNGIKLDRIEVSPENQGQGYASAAMRDLTAYADSRGVPVALTAERPDGTTGLSTPRLKAWYRSHGFVPNKGRNKNWAFMESMIRPPRPLPPGESG